MENQPELDGHVLMKKRGVKHTVKCVPIVKVKDVINVMEQVMWKRMKMVEKLIALVIVAGMFCFVYWFRRRNG